MATTLRRTYRGRVRAQLRDLAAQIRSLESYSTKHPLPVFVDATQALNFAATLAWVSAKLAQTS
jgi:hypothetical protein